MHQFDVLMGRLDEATRLPKGVGRAAAITAIRAEALALVSFGDGANVFAVVAEMALQAEVDGGYRLPILPKAADVPCPKCGGSGIFRWGSGEGDCFDCRGTGLVTRGQAAYRMANKPPVLVREASGITPFEAAPAIPEIDDIPF